MSEIRLLYSFPSRVGTINGPGTAAWHQVAGLVGQGLKVTLYAGSCEKPIEGLTDLKETLVPYRIKLPIRLLGKRHAVELHDRIVANAIRKIHKKSKIDIIHCWPSGALETLRTARELGIKTVLERLNTHTRYAFEIVGQECKKLGIKLPRGHSHRFDASRLRREEEEFELADLLLCPSDFVAKTFLDMGFERGKIARHQYGFDPALFSLPDDDNMQDSGTFKMLFAASCEPRKGLHYAIDAWLASKACRKGLFYICGRYVPGYRKLFSEKLNHPSVREMGFCNTLYSLMKKCHVFVLSSIEEGSPLVAYAARACGCVLLVSDAAGAICEHRKDALVHTPGDIDTLREHIDLLFSDESFYQMLRKNSLAGLDKLTWEKAAKVLVDIYRQALDPSKG